MMPLLSSDIGCNSTTSTTKKFLHGTNDRVKVTGSIQSNATAISLTSFLMALAIIKLRIIASHDAISRELDFVFQQTEAKRIQEVRSLVQEMLGGSDRVIQSQQLGRILDKTPSSLFDAMDELMGDYPFARSYEMDEFTRRYPFPMNIALSSGIRSLFRVPKSDKVLEMESFDVFGPFPE